MISWSYYEPRFDPNGSERISTLPSLGWKPEGAPFTRYSSNLDGLELTQWMIQDFEHLLGTDDKVDWELAKFNQERRQKIRLPNGWGS